MLNLPLSLLFWIAVPWTIYRSKRRWKTFFLVIGLWFSVAIGLAIVVALLAPAVHVPLAKAQALGKIDGQCALLLGIIAGALHSHQTRKDPTLTTIPLR